MPDSPPAETSQLAGTQFFAIVTVSRTAAATSGLARRSFGADGPVDETLRQDLSWRPDPVIVEWEYGDLGAELVRVSPAEADQLIESLRATWTSPS